MHWTFIVTALDKAKLFSTKKYYTADSVYVEY